MIDKYKPGRYHGCRLSAKDRRCVIPRQTLNPDKVIFVSYLVVGDIRDAGLEGGGH